MTKLKFTPCKAAKRLNFVQSFFPSVHQNMMDFIGRNWKVISYKSHICREKLSWSLTKMYIRIQRIEKLIQSDVLRCRASQQPDSFPSSHTSLLFPQFPSHPQRAFSTRILDILQILNPWHAKRCAFNRSMLSINVRGGNLWKKKVRSQNLFFFSWLIAWSRSWFLTLFLIKSMFSFFLESYFFAFFVFSFFSYNLSFIRLCPSVTPVAGLHFHDM